MGASAADAPPAASAPAAAPVRPAATLALARRAYADGRARTLAFAGLFAVVAFAVVVGYEDTFPTMRDRLTLVRGIGADVSVKLFYGQPYDLLSTGGYAAWRAGGFLSIFAAAWGMFAAVRALRTEEDAGRADLLLSGGMSRGGAYLAAVAAVLAGAATLWLALLVGLAAAGLPVGGSAYLALAIATPALVFAGAGALACQLAPSRRSALGLCSAALGAALALRVTADTVAGAGWVRWTTPLGWVEELRAFADPRPSALLVPLAATVLLLAAAGAIAARRDVGTGLLSTRDRRAPRLALLSSPTAQALRMERGTLVGWLVGIGAFAAVIGVVAASTAGAELPQELQRQVERLGASLTSASGVLGLYFLIFAFAISLFAAGQVVAMRREEAGQQLETLLVLPLGRRAWLAGRLALALAGCVALALVAGLLAWAGAAAQGADVSLPKLLAAGANCLPVVVLFLGLDVLAFALRPRMTTGLAYGLASAAFVWQLFGSLLGAPAWLLGLSPFHHMALVPAQDFKGLAAAIMVAGGAAALAAAFARFGRRDLMAE